MIDDIVGKDPAVGIFRGLRRIEAHHVGQQALGVDRRDRFGVGVVASMAHQVDEHGRPALAIVDRFAGVVFQHGVVGVEEAADRRVASAIDMEQLAVLPDAASPPNADRILGAELARRQFEHCREYVGLSVRIDAGPGSLDADLERGEVSFAQRAV